MANLERNYVVPLRQYWRMAPRYKRAKRAVNGLRRFVIRHMKVSEVKIGKELNDFILERGQRKPPARVQVTIVKEDMIGKVNIMGIPYSKEVKEEKKKLFGKASAKSSLEKTSEKEAKEEKHDHKPGEHHEHKHEEKSSLEQPFEKSLGKKTLEKTEEKKEHKEEKPKVKKAVKKKETSEDKK